MKIQTIHRPNGDDLEFPAINPAKHIFDPLLSAGFDRGGFQEFGGPLWMDFENLVPIPNIHQIVGHTPGALVGKKVTRQSKNYCLDVRNASVAAILSAGKLRILEGQETGRTNSALGT